MLKYLKAIQLLVLANLMKIFNYLFNIQVLPFFHKTPAGYFEF